jgi:hypothetical protein
VIARDHDYANSRVPAVGDRFFHVDARRVAESDQSEEIQALIGGDGLKRDRALG